MREKRVHLVEGNWSTPFERITKNVRCIAEHAFYLIKIQRIYSLIYNYSYLYKHNNMNVYTPSLVYRYCTIPILSFGPDR